MHTSWTSWWSCQVRKCTLKFFSHPKLEIFRGGKGAGMSYWKCTLNIVENALTLPGTDAFTSSTDTLRTPATRSFWPNIECV